VTKDYPSITYFLLKYDTIANPKLNVIIETTADISKKAPINEKEVTSVR